MQLSFSINEKWINRIEERNYDHLKLFSLLQWMNWIMPIFHAKVTFQDPGGCFHVKMSSYQYRNSHCGDKTILRPSYLHNGISFTGKTASLHWIRAQESTLVRHQSAWIDRLTYIDAWIEWMSFCRGNFWMDIADRIFSYFDLSFMDSFPSVQLTIKPAEVKVMV